MIGFLARAAMPFAVWCVGCAIVDAPTWAFGTGAFVCSLIALRQEAA
jgi:hypothetical protein